MTEQPAQTCVTLRDRRTDEWLVHEDLRPRLIAEAAEKDTSLTDHCVSILCASVGVAYTPNTRESKPREDAYQLMLRLPWDLESELGARYRSKAQAIREILSQHCGLPLPPSRRRGRTRTPAAA